MIMTYCTEDAVTPQATIQLGMWVGRAGKLRVIVVPMNMSEARVTG